MRGDISGHVIIHCDLNLNGESKTAPHVRTAPFRKDLMTRPMPTTATLQSFLTKNNFEALTDDSIDHGVKEGLQQEVGEYLRRF